MSTHRSGSAEVSSCGPVFGPVFAPVFAPVCALGETDCLRSRHSPQICASRVAAATATRVAPSSQVPGAARRSQARKCASARSRRTECGELAYETAAMFGSLTGARASDQGHALSTTHTNEVEPATPLSSSPQVARKDLRPQLPPEEAPVMDGRTARGLDEYQKPGPSRGYP